MPTYYVPRLPNAPRYRPPDEDPRTRAFTPPPNQPRTGFFQAVQGARDWLDGLRVPQFQVPQFPWPVMDPALDAVRTGRSAVRGAANYFGVPQFPVQEASNYFGVPQFQNPFMQQAQYGQGAPVQANSQVPAGTFTRSRTQSLTQPPAVPPPVPTKPNAGRYAWTDLENAARQMGSDSGVTAEQIFHYMKPGANLRGPLSPAQAAANAAADNAWSEEARRVGVLTGDRWRDDLIWKEHWAFNQGLSGRDPLLTGHMESVQRLEAKAEELLRQQHEQIYNDLQAARESQSQSTQQYVVPTFTPSEVPSFVEQPQESEPLNSSAGLGMASASMGAQRA